MAGRYAMFTNAFHGSRNGQHGLGPAWRDAQRLVPRLNAAMTHQAENVGRSNTAMHTNVEHIEKVDHPDYSHVVTFSHHFKGEGRGVVSRWGLNSKRRDAVSLSLDAPQTMPKGMLEERAATDPYHPPEHEGGFS